MTGNHWTVFNGSGAVVAEDISFDKMRDYLTPWRLRNRWSAVFCVVVKDEESLDALSSSRRRKEQSNELRTPPGTGY